MHISHKIVINILFGIGGIDKLDPTGSSGVLAGSPFALQIFFQTIMQPAAALSFIRKISGMRTMRW
jgi:hypothetical protein